MGGGVTTSSEWNKHPAAFTDAVLAGRFAAEVLADRMRWAKGLGWLAWDGQRWRPKAEEVVLEAARLWALNELAEALKLMRTGQADDKAFSSWHRVAQTASRLRSIVSLAKGIDDVLTDATVFDAHPDLLNVANGVVDLRVGELQPHDPDLLMTKLAPVDYVPGATHPDWTAALEAVPADCRSWLQLRYGQAVSGHTPPDDRLIVQQGPGENGKTTITGAAARAIGDYHVLVSDRVLLANPSDHPTELMELRGARLALVEETPEARRLSVARLKKTVGTPQITARLIRQDSVTFDATHTLLLSTNYRPIVEETDHGTWRRLLLLRFPYRWRKPHEPIEADTDRRGDPGLRERVQRGEDGQLEAVLAWLVDGAAVWYALGQMPEPPPRVTADTRAWRTESDVVLGYIEDALIFDAAAHVIASELLADLNDWLVSHGQRPWSDKLLTARLGDHAELAAHNVTRRKRRLGEGLSRRASGWHAGAMPTLASPPQQYHAWLGLAFQQDQRDRTRAPGKRGLGQVGRVIPYVSRETSLAALPEVPSHPSQTILTSPRSEP
jgi:putative DNA primase/helicase